MIETNPDNTEFVLPIVCPHCSKEINLAMMFALLAPNTGVPKEVVEDEEDQEGTRDMPPHEPEEEEA